MKKTTTTQNREIFYDSKRGYKKKHDRGGGVEGEEGVGEEDEGEGEGEGNETPLVIN